jgi:hypothetical protein
MSAEKVDHKPSVPSLIMVSSGSRLCSAAGTYHLPLGSITIAVTLCIAGVIMLRTHGSMTKIHVVCSRIITKVRHGPVRNRRQ